MLINEENIKSFLPHREPFIMVNNLEYIEEGYYTSSFFIDSGNIYCDQNLLSEYAIIENMAQTCALAITYSGINTELKINDGFLAAIKKCDFYNLPLVDTILYTKVKLIQQYGKMFLFHCISSNNTKKYVEGYLKISGINSNSLKIIP